jgi:ribonuclease HII
MYLVTSPSLDVELRLLADYDTIIGVDEVGRGALAGPVAVGAAAMNKQTITDVPVGLRDSKLIAESKRDEIALKSAAWVNHAVGYSAVFEIEQNGITKALADAATGAIAQLIQGKTIVLLDGSHNWLRDSGLSVDYHVQVKADRDCAIVSAAALAAKVDRDNLMRLLHAKFPDYDWAGNKGYASPSHIAAIQNLGPTPHHRLSWLTKILGEANSLF